LVEREEGLAKMKETMLQYITMRIEYHTGREVLERYVPTIVFFLHQCVESKVFFPIRIRNHDFGSGMRKDPDYLQFLL